MSNLKVLTEQLAGALSSESRLDPMKFEVEVIEHTNASRPGYDFPGVLPIEVVGHADMDPKEFWEWLGELDLQFSIFNLFNRVTFFISLKLFFSPVFSWVRH